MSSPTCGLWICSIGSYVGMLICWYVDTLIALYVFFASKLTFGHDGHYGKLTFGHDGHYGKMTFGLFGHYGKLTFGLDGHYSKLTFGLRNSLLFEFRKTTTLDKRNKYNLTATSLCRVTFLFSAMK